MRLGDEWPKKRDMSCLRLLGSVGEPINPEAWMWFYEYNRQEKLPHNGHMVADRDRNAHDIPGASHPAQAGNSNKAGCRA